MIRLTNKSSLITKVDGIQEFIIGIEGDWPKIKGFIHAAGLLKDAPISEQGYFTLCDAIYPKIKGAAAFHTVLERNGLNKDLHHFIVFSSTASMVGNM